MLPSPPHGLRAALDHGGNDPDPRSLRPAVPVQTVANLIGQVILRGRSIRTQTAYRVDLHDFLLWLGPCGYTEP